MPPKGQSFNPQQVARDPIASNFLQHDITSGAHQGSQGRNPTPAKAAPSVPLGFVYLTSTTPALKLVALMGEEPPTVTGGYGGWELVDRPRRPSITSWKGSEPYRMTLSLMFDGHRRGLSIERQVSAIERMARDPGGDAQPPIVKAYGALPRKNVNWVVESIEWGDAMRNKRGERTRQAVTLTLLQFVADQQIARLPPAKARKTARKPNTKRFYTVRKGDTLHKIAARELGSANQWKVIAKLNNIRDGKQVKVGRKLRLPVNKGDDVRLGA